MAARQGRGERVDEQRDEEERHQRKERGQQVPERKSAAKIETPFERGARVGGVVCGEGVAAL
ncbi:MAG TPA: hypothetical protein VGB76_21795 [Pyrinomonadaceae bacterium]